MLLRGLVVALAAVGLVGACAQSTPTLVPTPTPAATPTGQPSAKLAPTPTNTPTPSSTPLPTATPTVRPTPAIAPDPTPTLTPTATPSPSPTPTPTSTPTPVPADAPRFSLEPGLYIGAHAVEITGEPGALVNYTLDRSEPSPVNGLEYTGPVTLPTGGNTVLKAVTYGPGWITLEVSESKYDIYASRVDSAGPLLLTGDDELVIEDTYFVHNADIELRDNARLVVRNARVLHVIAFNMEFGLGAHGESQVVLENAQIETACTGSLNWNYFENSSLSANQVSFPACNTWSLVTDSASATIDGCDYFGGTVCDEGDVEIRNSMDMEIELCYPANAVVDEDLSTEITEFVFPNENDAGIDWALRIFDSSIDGWGITIAPGVDATFRNGVATVSVIVGLPWQGQTVILDGIDKKVYEDTTFEVVDARLRLINTRIYGWEANVWNGNTLIVRNANFSGATLNGGESVEIIENSLLGLVRGQDRVQITVRNSRIQGDVIATENSVITLIDSTVERTGEDSGGNVFAVDSGKVILIGTEVQGNSFIEDNGEIETRAP